MMTWKIGRWSHVARLEPEHVQVNHQKWRFIMVYHGLTMGIKGEYSQQNRMEYQIAPRRDPRERKMTKYSTFHQSFVLGYLMLGELIAEYGGETEIRDAQFSSRSGSTGGINCFGDPNCKKHSSNGIYHRSKKKVVLLRLLSALWQSGFKTIFNHVAVRHLAFKVSSICPILSDTTPKCRELPKNH